MTVFAVVPAMKSNSDSLPPEASAQHRTKDSPADSVMQYIGLVNCKYIVCGKDVSIYVRLVIWFPSSDRRDEHDS